jgi:hypothetical protein
MDFVFANNASSTLAGAILAGDTILQLAAGTGDRFPDPIQYSEQFTLTLKHPVTGENEIVYVLERIGDTIWVARGQEGTIASAFPAGSPAVHTLTAGALEYLRDL